VGHVAEQQEKVIIAPAIILPSQTLANQLLKETAGTKASKDGVACLVKVQLLDLGAIVALARLQHEVI